MYLILKKCVIFLNIFLSGFVFSITYFFNKLNIFVYYYINILIINLIIILYVIIYFLFLRKYKFIRELIENEK